MKYLAFDLEIAFDFHHIDIDAFQPDDEEMVLLNGEIINEDKDEEEILIRAWYLAGTNEFRLIDGRVVTAKKTHWAYQGNDWKRFRPLGITCAAAASSDGGLWNWWANAGGKFIDKMPMLDIINMVEKLMDLVKSGYTLLTWNGLGFDFDVISEESGMHEQCKKLALEHIDMMFHFLCSKGFGLGLDTASKGMGLPGKPGGMDGAKAPELWPTNPHKVMAYCSLDAKNTLWLAEACDKAYCLEWTAQSGRRNTWYSRKWLPVKEALALPKPDTSWMDDPDQWTRSKFYGWTEYEPASSTVPSQLFDPTGIAQWDPDEGFQLIDGPDETKPDDMDYDEMEEDEWKEIQGE